MQPYLPVSLGDGVLAQVMEWTWMKSIRLRWFATPCATTAEIEIVHVGDGGTSLEGDSSLATNTAASASTCYARTATRVEHVECVVRGGVAATIFSGLAAIDNNDDDGILESSHIPRVCHLAVNDEGEAVECVCATSWQMKMQAPASFAAT